MHAMREEFIFMPTNITELRRVSNNYEETGLPGCCGSMDVVHVKWSSCPTGVYNHAKGKGGCPKHVGSFGYSTLASEEKASEK